MAEQEEQPLTASDSPVPGPKRTGRAVALARLLHYECTQLLQLYVSSPAPHRAVPHGSSTVPLNAVRPCAETASYLSRCCVRGLLQTLNIRKMKMSVPKCPNCNHAERRYKAFHYPPARWIFGIFFLLVGLHSFNKNIKINQCHQHYFHIVCTFKFILKKGYSLHFTWCILHMIFTFSTHLGYFIVCIFFLERKGDLLDGPRPRRWTDGVSVLRGRRARYRRAGGAAALGSATVFGAAPLCHPKGGGRVGQAGGRL